MDTYRDKLCEIIQAKQRGETVRAAPVEEAEAPSDLMDALRASLTAAHARRGGNRRPGRGLSGLSKEELYELARAADIAGRSDMSKDQLIDALAAA